MMTLACPVVNDTFAGSSSFLVLRRRGFVAEFLTNPVTSTRAARDASSPNDFRIWFGRGGRRTEPQRLAMENYGLEAGERVAPDSPGDAGSRGVRPRSSEWSALAPWLKRATESVFPEYRAFVMVLDRDRAAVEAALNYECSNGQTEGQITRLKLTKRQMYGRGSLALLKARVLPTA